MDICAQITYGYGPSERERYQPFLSLAHMLRGPILLPRSPLAPVDGMPHPPRPDWVARGLVGVLQRAIGVLHRGGGVSLVGCRLPFVRYRG